MINRFENKYGNFDEIDKMRIYLEYHPEVFTEEFMEELANKYLNYLTVRKKIKEMWSILCMENINNIEILPNNYEEAQEIFKNKKSY